MRFSWLLVIIISLFSLNILSHRYYISSSFNYHLYLVDSFQKSVFPVLSIHLNFTYSNCLMDISNGLAYHNKNNIYKITLNIFQHLSSLSLSPSPLQLFLSFPFPLTQFLHMPQWPYHFQNISRSENFGFSLDNPDIQTITKLMP